MGSFVFLLLCCAEAFGLLQIVPAQSIQHRTDGSEFGDAVIDGSDTRRQPAGENEMGLDFEAARDGDGEVPRAHPGRHTADAFTDDGGHRAGRAVQLRRQPRALPRPKASRNVTARDGQVERPPVDEEIVGILHARSMRLPHPLPRTHFNASCIFSPRQGRRGLSLLPMCLRPVSSF